MNELKVSQIETHTEVTSRYQLSDRNTERGRKRDGSQRGKGRDQEYEKRER